MIVKLIVDGGNMKPGPAVAQQLGPMGIDLGKITAKVNEETAGFKGMKVPVEIDVDPATKEFTISVSSPPVSELIKKQLSIKKGSGEPGKVYVGNLAIEEIISIAKTKMPDMLAKDLKAAVKLVLGSCVALGTFVESKNPKEIEEEVAQGKYDSEISKEKTEVSSEKKSELDSFFKEKEVEQAAAKAAEEEAKAAEEEAKAAESPEEESGETKPEEEKEEKKEEEKK